MTTAQRNALTGDDLFIGRLIFNTNTGMRETWDGLAWVSQPNPNARFASGGLTVIQPGVPKGVPMLNRIFSSGVTASFGNVLPLQIRPQVGGVYLMTGGVRFTTENISDLELTIRKGGIVISHSHRRNDDSVLSGITITDTANLVIGDELELWIQQQSAGPKTLSPSGTYFSICRVAD
jgi:hypothetical protein